jgi:hypothetical protein
VKAGSSSTIHPEVHMKKLVRIAAIAVLAQAAACADAPTGPASPTAAMSSVSAGPANSECRSGYLVVSGRACESEAP